MVEIGGGMVMKCEISEGTHWFWKQRLSQGLAIVCDCLKRALDSSKLTSLQAIFHVVDSSVFEL